MANPGISMAILFGFLPLGFFVHGHYVPAKGTAFHGGRESLFIMGGEGAGSR